MAEGSEFSGSNPLGRVVARLPPEQRAEALLLAAADLRGIDDLLPAKWILELVQAGQDSLIENRIKEFLLRIYTAGHAANVLALATTTPLVRAWVFEHIYHDISKHLSLLSQAPLDHVLQDLALDVSNTSQSDDASHSFFRDDALCPQEALVYHLDSLAKALNADLRIDPGDCLLDVLEPTLCCTFSEVAIAARNLAATWLRSCMTIDNAASMSERKTPSDIAWAWVQSLLKSQLVKIHLPLGLFLWSCWIQVPHDPARLRTQLEDLQYWSQIQAALPSEDIEVRKLAILVLRRSLALLKERGLAIDNPYVTIPASGSLRDTSLDELHRFCTIYEAITIGRYLNQATESIPLLDQLSSASSTVKKTWLLALLTCAMSNKLQDSLRNLFGNWTIRSPVLDGKASAEVESFLSQRVLPWMLQGDLFTASVVHSSAGVRCLHGEALSSFVMRLIKSALPASSQNLPARLIIDHIAVAKHKINQTALIYVTSSLCAALCSSKERVLSQEQLNILIDLPFQAGLSEVSKDILVRLAVEVADVHAVEIKKDLINQHIYQRLLSEHKLLAAKRAPGIPHDSDVEIYADIETLHHQIVSSRHQCLAKGALLPALTWLRKQLQQRPTIRTENDVLIEVLDALLDQVEIQDWNKDTVILLPDIWLSETCIIEASYNPDLQQRQYKLVSTLTSMCQTRLYLLSPLMIAFRNAETLRPGATCALGIIDVVKYLTRHVPSPGIDSLLEESVVNHFCQSRDVDPITFLEGHYGASASRGFAALFAIINNFPSVNPQLADSMLSDCLKPWLTQKQPVIPSSKWKTTEQLQVILLLLESNLIKHDQSIAESRLSDVLLLLKLEPLPRYRYLLEWMVCSIVIKHIGLYQTLLNLFNSTTHSGNPKFIASLIKIVVNLTCSTYGTVKMAESLVGHIVTLSASAKISIRLEAQWCLTRLYKHAERHAWTVLTQNAAFAGLALALLDSEKSMIINPDRLKARFDIDRDMTLTNLVSGRYLQLSPPGKVLCSHEDFVQLYKLDIRNETSTSDPSRQALPLGRPIDQKGITTSTEEPVVATSKPDTASAHGALDALQTKGSSYLSSTMMDMSSARTRSNLIVVGSLVENPYNLGGLSRVAEIFGASALYLPNLAVLSNKDFESVAVSSHLYMKTEALKPDDIVSFLERLRAQDYCIVGIEQTDRSQMLGAESTKLPEKTVLVLGAEKLGMPADIMSSCDMLVEIQQKGYTRSMNVQTAAGCVLFEYRRQHP